MTNTHNQRGAFFLGKVPFFEAFCQARKNEGNKNAGGTAAATSRLGERILSQTKVEGTDTQSPHAKRTGSKVSL